MVSLLCVCARTRVYAHVRACVCVPGRCPTVWLCSAAAALSSKGCSSSGRQTAGTPPRTAACGGAPTLSKQCSWLTTNNTRQTQKQERGREEKIKFQHYFFFFFGRRRRASVALTGRLLCDLLASHSMQKPNYNARATEMKNAGALGVKKSPTQDVCAQLGNTTFISRCLQKLSYYWIYGYSCSLCRLPGHWWWCKGGQWKKEVVGSNPLSVWRLHALPIVPALGALAAKP